MEVISWLSALDTDDVRSGTGGEAESGSERSGAVDATRKALSSRSNVNQEGSRPVRALQPVWFVKHRRINRVVSKWCTNLEYPKSVSTRMC